MKNERDRLSAKGPCSRISKLSEGPVATLIHTPSTDSAYLLAKHLALAIETFIASEFELGGKS